MDVNPDLKRLVGRNISIIVFLLQLLFIAIYSKTEIQPFVYIRF